MKNTFEVKHNIYPINIILKLLESNRNIMLKGKERDVCIGHDFPVKINTNIGVSHKRRYDIELKKIKMLTKLSYRPDTIMDHTIVDLKYPFWKTILKEYDGPVGTLPHYLSYEDNKGIDKNRFIELFEEMAESGVSFMTIHPTATLELYELAKIKRNIPTTSRGGSNLIKDSIINNRNENIIADNYDKILAISKKHNMALSIGTTFRPACIEEALDDVHIKETKLQLAYVKKTKQQGVKVLMEGIGHITIDKMEIYCKYLKKYKIPFMPLGPIPTDSTIGFDHVSSAIGAAFLCYFGLSCIINSVTREEHTGGVPNYESILEGLMSARVAAHSVNVSKYDKLKKMDYAVAIQRSKMKTCKVSGGIFSYFAEKVSESGCTRCCHECPLIEI